MVALSEVFLTFALVMCAGILLSIILLVELRRSLCLLSSWWAASFSSLRAETKVVRRAFSAVIVTGDGETSQLDILLLTELDFNISMVVVLAPQILVNGRKLRFA